MIEFTQRSSLSRSAAPSCRRCARQAMPFPTIFGATILPAISIGNIDEQSNEDAGSRRHARVSVAGRMMLKRVMGKASFATIQDMSGRIQLYITERRGRASTQRRSSTRTSATSSARRARCSGPRPASCRSRVTKLRLLDQVAAPAAGEIPRPGRSGAEISPALSST